MTLQTFKDSIKDPEPPLGLNPVLEALWWDARLEWDRAHRIVQVIESKQAAWVHAYLHRKEGDPGNASYWYSRAGKKMPQSSINKEWDEISAVLLSQL